MADRFTPNNLSGTPFAAMAAGGNNKPPMRVRLRGSQILPDYQHQCWKEEATVIDITYDDVFSIFKQEHDVPGPPHIYRIIVHFDHEEGVEEERYRASLLPCMLEKVEP